MCNLRVGFNLYLQLFISLFASTLPFNHYFAKSKEKLREVLLYFAANSLLQEYLWKWEKGLIWTKYLKQLFAWVFICGYSPICKARFICL